jgi:hypothetical protein
MNLHCSHYKYFTASLGLVVLKKVLMKSGLESYVFIHAPNFFTVGESFKCGLN